MFGIFQEEFSELMYSNKLDTNVDSDLIFPLSIVILKLTVIISVQFALICDRWF